MTTLHIEHPVTDFETWLRAFDSFASIRARSGIRGYTIRRPVDDPKYLMLDLEFDTAERAEAFADFLHSRVWPSDIASPAIDGTPKTRVCDVVRVADLMA
ncbi:MAG TPA: hypothetical protein VFQ44_13965 [Streptosporangiaceae bacterium]|nr:hypothetical protein [Streptosporangiaceae bacterium]